MMASTCGLKKIKIKSLILGVFFLSFAACKSNNAVDDLIGAPNGDGFGVGNSAIEFTPGNYDFGLIATGAESSEQTFVIKNLANDPIYISSIGSSANLNYQLISHDCPITPSALASNTTCSAILKFTPQTGGGLDYSLAVIFGATKTDTSYSASGVITGTGVSAVVFAGLTSITDVRSSSVVLNWSDATNESGYLWFVKDVDAAQPFILGGTLTANTTSYTVTGLNQNNNYEFRVRALDLFGAQELNTVDIPVQTLQTPVLTDISDRNFLSVSGPIDVNSTLNIDVNNTANSTVNDTDMYYTCTYDQVIDGAVTAGADCSTLSGFTLDAGFSGTLNSVDGNGIFSWTPPLSLAGQAYEIRISGNDGGGEIEEIFMVNIRSLYKKDATLLVDLQASYADSMSQGINSPMTTVWKNLNELTSPLYDGSLLGTFATGWGGTMTYNDPYSLTVDGNSGASASRIDLGVNAGINNLSTFMFSGWLSPSDLSSGLETTIYGNGGGVENGWALRQSDTGEIKLDMGQAQAYDSAVLSTNPVAYYRMEETSGLVAYDSSVSGNDADYISSGSIAVNQTGWLDQSYRFTGSGYIRPAVAIDINTNWTISLWMKFPVPSNGVWKTITRGSLYHQIILQDSTNIIGSYIGGFRSSGFDTDTLAAGWHHVAAVADSGVTTFYIDGLSVGSTPFVATDDVYAIGNYQGGGQPAYDIDEFAVYTTNLTPAQILAQATAATGCSASTYEGWQHVGGLYDGTKAKLFINGVKQCEFEPTGTINASTKAFVMGAEEDGSSAWQGKYFTFKLYDSGSDADVITNYQADASNIALRNCKEVLAAGYTTDGVYLISPGSGAGVFPVFCDMTTAGGGWTLIGKGRQGWTWDNNGEGTQLDLANSPDSYAVSHLTQAQVQAILDSTGKDLTQLTDGIRISRQVDATTWQEFRWNFTAQTTWNWAFDAAAGMAVTASIDGVAAGAGNTRDSNWGGSNDYKRIFTWAWGSHNSQRGFAFGSTATCVAPRWCYTTENHAIPHSKVYIRD